MALFVRNIVRVVALVIVLKGVSISCMALTDSSIACNSDPEACRYDCPAGVIQNHNCTTEKDVHDPVEGKCCPAFFKTENNRCQVCPDVHFMPDVNNCCECLPCSECDDVKNNTIVTRCSHTNDTACKIPNDPPLRAPSACPWIESTSTPTTQVPTTHGPTTDTEEVTVDTQSDPQRSKSERIYEGGFYTVTVLFILLFGFVVLICCYLCYAHHSAVRSPPATTAATNSTVSPQGGTDQPDKGDKTWKVVATIVADETEQPNREVQTWKGVANIILEQPNGEVKTWKGDASIVAGENEQPNGEVQTWKGVASMVAAQICRTCAECRAACRDQSATATGGQSQTATGGQSATPTGSQPHNMGDDEPDERGNQKTAPPGDQSGGGVQAEVQEGEDANHNDSGHAREPGELDPFLRDVVPPRVEDHEANV